MLAPVSDHEGTHSVSTSQHTVSPASMSELRQVLPDLAHPDGSPVRALVVDAEPLVADLLSMGFSLCGWETQVARDGAMGVQEGTRRRPDLVHREPRRRPCGHALRRR